MVKSHFNTGRQFSKVVSLTFHNSVPKKYLYESYLFAYYTYVTLINKDYYCSFKCYIWFTTQRKQVDNVVKRTELLIITEKIDDKLLIYIYREIEYQFSTYNCFILFQ